MGKSPNWYHRPTANTTKGKFVQIALTAPPEWMDGWCILWGEVEKWCHRPTAGETSAVGDCANQPHRPTASGNQTKDSGVEVTVQAEEVVEG